MPTKGIFLNMLDCSFKVMKSRIELPQVRLQMSYASMIVSDLMHVLSEPSKAPGINKQVAILGRMPINCNLSFNRPRLTLHRKCKLINVAVSISKRGARNYRACQS